MTQISADELSIKYGMTAHEENGLYRLMRYAHTAEERAPSGSILYYLGADEHSIFHSIDCDEYWAYNEGETLELWIIYPDKSFSVVYLGTCGDAVPLAFVPKGSIFACRHAKDGEDGTLISAITVPGYIEAHSNTLYTKEDMIRRFPFIEDFWK